MKNPSCKDAYDAKERAPFLELAELLDALAGAGQNAQDVESDLETWLVSTPTRARELG